MDDLVERLAVRIHDELASPRTSRETIGRLGSLLFGSDDTDVAALRGESEKEIEIGELPFLFAQAVHFLNDPRVKAVSVDGTDKDSEVMIDVSGGITFIIRSGSIDAVATETLEG